MGGPAIEIVIPFLHQFFCVVEGFLEARLLCGADGGKKKLNSGRVHVVIDGDDIKAGRRKWKGNEGGSLLKGEMQLVWARGIKRPYIAGKTPIGKLCGQTLHAHLIIGTKDGQDLIT